MEISAFDRGHAAADQLAVAQNLRLNPGCAVIAEFGRPGVIALLQRPERFSWSRCSISVWAFGLRLGRRRGDYWLHGGNPGGGVASSVHRTRRRSSIRCPVARKVACEQTIADLTLSPAASLTNLIR